MVLFDGLFFDRCRQFLMAVLYHRNEALAHAFERV